LREELGGLVGLLVNPTQAADVGFEESDYGAAVLLCPRRINRDGVN